MDLKIVEATEDMADQLISYHNEHFGDERKPEHWKWEYKGCYPDLSIFSVIKDNGRIVATFGAIPIYLNVAGERVLTGKLENALVSPEYRGGEVACMARTTNENKAREVGLQFFWAYAPIYKTSVREGYEVFKGAICSMAAVIRPMVAASDVLKSKRRSLKKRITAISNRFVLWAYGTIRRFTVTSSNRVYVVRSSVLGPNDLHDLFERLRDRYPNMINIDLNSQYLDWRIHNHPFFKYETYYVYEGENLVAYAFVNSSSGFRGYLTDFGFENMNAGEFLLSRILRDLREKNVGLVAFVGNCHNPLVKESFKLLRRWGFVHYNSTHLHVKNLRFKHGQILSNAENWYMTGIGTEGFFL
jgi:hypothetical protein